MPLTFDTCGPGACTAAGRSSPWLGVLGDCPHGPGTGRPRPAVSCPQWQFPRGWKTAFLQKVQDSYFFGLCAFTHVARNFMKNTLGWS